MRLSSLRGFDASNKDGSAPGYRLLRYDPVRPFRGVLPYAADAPKSFNSTAVDNTEAN